MKDFTGTIVLITILKLKKHHYSVQIVLYSINIYCEYLPLNEYLVQIGPVYDEY